MIITLEEHFTTAAFLKATAKQMPDAAHSAKLEERLLDLGAGRIAAMDAEGVDLQVLSVAATGQEKLDASTATALVREANDDWPLQVGADRLMYSVDYPYRENAAGQEFLKCLTVYVKLTHGNAQRLLRLCGQNRKGEGDQR